jgi:hypothetical protein
MSQNHEELTIDNLKGRLNHNTRYYGRFKNANRAFGALATATLINLDDNPKFRDGIEHFVEVRGQEMTASHGLKLLERSYQELLMILRDRTDISPELTGYPHGFGNVDRWITVQNYFSNEPVLDDAVHKHLILDDVQTNIADRDKAVKLIAMAYDERFGDQPSRLDIGPSIGQGMIMSVFNRSPHTPKLSFGPMRLGGPIAPAELDAARHNMYRPRSDKRLTRLANTALNNYYEFGEVRGVEKSNVYDQGTQQWVRYSHYPQELVDGKTLRKFDEVASLDPNYERVHMTVADITSREGLRILEEDSGAKEYDIVSCITMLYQIKDASERMKLIYNLASFVKEGGIIIIQDALNGNFETPYEYTTYVIDTARPGWKMEALLHWGNARCKTAVVGSGTINVEGHRIQFHEALENLIT